MFPFYAVQLAGGTLCGYFKNHGTLSDEPSTGVEGCTLNLAQNIYQTPCVWDADPIHIWSGEMPKVPAIASCTFHRRHFFLQFHTFGDNQPRQLWLLVELPPNRQPT